MLKKLLEFIKKKLYAQKKYWILKICLLLLLGSSLVFWAIDAKNTDKLIHVPGTSYAQPGSIVTLRERPKNIVAQAKDHINYKVISSRRLDIKTYDGSNQAVHPDVVYVPESFHGWFYWMAYTPYPSGNMRKENPSIAVSNDGINWQTPTGLKNPLALPSKNRKDHLSDADILFVQSKLYLYYRESIAGTLGDIVWQKTSSDGIHWSVPISVLKKDEFLSPAIIYRNNQFEMYGINANKKIEKRTSVDGITWSKPTISPFSIPGKNLWHIDAALDKTSLRETLIFLIVGQNSRSKAFDSLYMATSQDGVAISLKYPMSIVSQETDKWHKKSIYRGSIMPFQQKDKKKLYKIWYSGCTPGRVWSLGYLEFYP